MDSGAIRQQKRVRFQHRLRPDKRRGISKSISLDNRTEPRRSGREPERLMAGVGANNPSKLSRIAGLSDQSGSPKT